jgi:hypothetical protein
MAEGPSIWATDDHPSPDGGLQLPLQVTLPARLFNDRLVVAVGVLRDPYLDVLRSIDQSETDILLKAIYTQAITRGAEAQACVQQIKKEVSRAVSLHNPKGIDLYYAGPAWLFVALGHRWNALPKTQVFEFLAGAGRYVPTFSTS